MSKVLGRINRAQKYLFLPKPMFVAMTSHLAVVLFLGAVTQGEPLLILNEFLPGGNLVGEPRCVVFGAICNFSCKPVFVFTPTLRLYVQNVNG